MRFLLTLLLIILLSKISFAGFKPKHHILDNGLEIVVIENNKVPAIGIKSVLPMNLMESLV